MSINDQDNSQPPPLEHDNGDVYVGTGLSDGVGPDSDSGESDHTPTFAVEKIVDHNWDANTQRYYYRVRWHGFSAKDDTWQHAGTFLDGNMLPDYVMENGFDPTVPPAGVKPRKKKAAPAKKKEAPAPAEKEKEAPEPAEKKEEPPAEKKEEPPAEKKEEPPAQKKEAPAKKVIKKTAPKKKPAKKVVKKKVKAVPKKKAKPVSKKKPVPKKKAKTKKQAPATKSKKKRKRGDEMDTETPNTKRRKVAQEESESEEETEEETGKDSEQMALVLKCVMAGPDWYPHELLRGPLMQKCIKCGKETSAFCFGCGIDHVGQFFYCGKRNGGCFDKVHEQMDGGGRGAGKKTKS